MITTVGWHMLWQAHMACNPAPASCTAEADVVCTMRLRPRYTLTYSPSALSAEHKRNGGICAPVVLPASRTCVSPALPTERAAQICVEGACAVPRHTIATRCCRTLLSPFCRMEQGVSQSR
jgi:hypothetical protein